MAADDELEGVRLYDAFMAIKPAGLAETDWALAAGVNRGFFGNLKTKSKNPRRDTVRKLLAHINRTEADLQADAPVAPKAGGRQTSTKASNVLSVGAGANGNTPSSLEEIGEQHGLAFVEEVDLALGMGASYLDGSTPEVLGLAPFRTDWLRGLYSGPVDRLKVVRGRGDSMQPTIHDQDVVLIDTAQRRIEDQDLIWAIAYGELGMIRRVRVTSKGTWLLMPDNHVVRPDEVGDGEASIIGRVIWIGRRFG